MESGLPTNLTCKCHALSMIPVSAIRQTPLGVQLTVFKLPVRTIKGIGAAVGQGGPDFWCSNEGPPCLVAAQHRSVASPGHQPHNPVRAA